MLGDARMLEIGAGTGALTLALLEEGAPLTVIEIDGELVSILRERDDLRAATIVHADALAFDYAAFAAAGRVARGRKSSLQHRNAADCSQLVEMEHGPQSIVAMIQKDVADRMSARPSTPAYGSLSVAVQYAMHVERAFTLGPRAFFPPPKVDSTVIALAAPQRASRASARPRMLSEGRARGVRVPPQDTRQ